MVLVKMVDLVHEYLKKSNEMVIRNHAKIMILTLSPRFHFLEQLHQLITYVYQKFELRNLTSQLLNDMVT